MRVSSNQLSTGGLRELLARQAELQKTQLQLATGKRVLKPSDDPVAATTISALNVEIEKLQQYQRSGELAKSNNQIEESVLTSVNDVLFRINDLMIQSVNGSYGEQEVNAIAEELEQRLDELLGLANTRNAQGDYLFSGSRVNVQAFTKDAAGNFIYNGDQSQRSLQISSGVATPISDSGFDVFVDVKNGNGSFSTAASSANTGDGVIGPGSYQSPPNFLPEAYTISFATDINGNTTYTVTGDTSGATITGPVIWQPGDDISFTSSVAGFVSGTVNIGIDGTPVAGDQFHIQPSQSEDLFSVVQSAIDAYRSFADNPADRAKMISQINTAQESLHRHQENIDLVRAKIGSRLNAVESEFESNENLLLTTRTGLSKVQDLDYVEASTRLSQQLNVLEAAQASFVRIQDLNLFNFLR